MTPIDRRQFVTTVVLTAASGAAATLTRDVPAEAMSAASSKTATVTVEEAPLAASSQTAANPAEPAPDFRYAPHTWQTTFCFPDDPHKSLVGERGDLRCDFRPDKFAWPNEFGAIVEFGLQGMQVEQVRAQRLQGPGVPIVHTILERPAANIELVTFATNQESEGRVDNVLMKVQSATGSIHAAPLVRLRSSDQFSISNEAGPLAVVLRKLSGTPFLIAAQVTHPPAVGGASWGQEEGGACLCLPIVTVSADKPLRYFFRFPQAGQSLDQLRAGMTKPDELLAEATAFWGHWRAFGGQVGWSLPGRPHEFLVACARNIQQAREVKNSRSVFQVGPTVYRGLWIVDGNFLLEAARYLGYDKEAEEGLRSEWSNQLSNGQVVAGGGDEHWKDTAIAMFTLVRQCELSQDWRLFSELEPNVLRAVQFLIRLRDQARKGNSSNGRYGLLAPGFPDGGVGGVRSEFTNTVWTLAGLRAVVEAGEQHGMKSVDRVAGFYRELREAFFAAARQEMVRHPQGFEYLPMLMKDDPIFQDPDIWVRPRPQSAQWALSHAIFPGLVFAKDDPIVRGHIALMQACTQEDIPAETGWILHDGLWNYGSSFAAHVYLWAGLRDWAHATFTGFLNHASPLYCWREEQPLQNALVSRIWGDMPHNWASAECVRYLRHMFVLEDGPALRLVDGVGDPELRLGKPCELSYTPTRFGRVGVRLEPLGAGKGWKLKFVREAGPAPKAVELPGTLGATLNFNRAEGAAVRMSGTRISVDPEASSWTAYWM